MIAIWKIFFKSLSSIYKRLRQTESDIADLELNKVSVNSFQSLVNQMNTPPQYTGVNTVKFDYIRGEKWELIFYNDIAYHARLIFYNDIAYHARLFFYAKNNILTFSRDGVEYATTYPMIAGYTYKVNVNLTTISITASATSNFSIVTYAKLPELTSFVKAVKI